MRLVSLFVLLVACGRPAVGIWSGETLDCDDPADDGVDLTLAIANGQGSDASLTILTPLGFASGAVVSCEGAAVPVSARETHLEVEPALTCEGFEIRYTVEADIAGDAMTGEISWNSGACSFEASRGE